MKIHESLLPSMTQASKSLYRKLSLCSYNSEVGKKMLIVPTDDEVCLMFWMLKEFCDENGIEVNE